MVANWISLIVFFLKEAAKKSVFAELFRFVAARDFLYADLGKGISILPIVRD